MTRLQHLLERWFPIAEQLPPGIKPYPFSGQDVFMTANLCTACKWYYRGPSLAQVCSRNATRTISPVDGQTAVTGEMSDCHKERAELSAGEMQLGSNRCGPEGRHFIERMTPSTFSTRPAEIHKA